MYRVPWAKKARLDLAARKSLTGRLAFWSGLLVPLLLIVLLGRYVGDASGVFASALKGWVGAPVAVSVLRAATLIYFLPLALRGLSPGPVYALAVVYLVAGFVLLARRKWMPAVIVLLLPLAFTIPVSIAAIRTAHGEVADVKDAFRAAMVASQAHDLELAVAQDSSEIHDLGEGVSNVDYRLVVFDSSGSRATLATVVTTWRTWTVKNPDGTSRDYRHEYKSDYAAEIARQSSGTWVVASVSKDFHSGYEP